MKKWKGTTKWLAVLLSLCMVVAVIPITALADETAAENYEVDFGDGSWIIEDMTVSADKNGALNLFETDVITLTNFNADKMEVRISASDGFNTTLEVVDNKTSLSARNNEGGIPATITFSVVAKSSGDEGNGSGIVPAFAGEQMVSVGYGDFEVPHFVMFMENDELQGIEGTVSYMWNEGDNRRFDTYEDLRDFLAEQSAGMVITVDYLFLSNGDIDFMDVGTLTFTMVNDVDEVNITIDKPQTGEALATTAGVTGSAGGQAVNSDCLVVQEIEWSVSDEYMAIIAIRADRGVGFADNVTATVNGSPANDSYFTYSESGEKILLVTYMFAGENDTLDTINNINITLSSPIIGCDIEKNSPNAFITDSVKYKIDSAKWIKGVYTEVGDSFEETVTGTFEPDTWYYAEIFISVNSGYTIDSGCTIMVNGQQPAEVFAIYGGTDTHFIAKIKAVESSESTTEDKTSAPVEVTTENGVKSLPSTVNESKLVEAAQAAVKAVETMKTTAGKTVEVISNEAPTLTKDVLKAMEETGKNVTIGVTDENNRLQYSWTFSSRTLNNTDMDIDLSITFDSEKKEQIESLTGTKDALYVQFAYHGELPGPATVKTYVGDKYANGEKVYLYYFDEEQQKILLVGNKQLEVKAGYVEYTITHCSTYFFDVKRLEGVETDKKSLADPTVNVVDLTDNEAKEIVGEISKTGDLAASKVIFSILVALACAGVFMVSAYKRKRESVF